MKIRSTEWTTLRRALLAGLLVAMPAWATMGPWETAVTRLQTTFTGPIATGLSLVAVIIGGLMFAFGEGGSKRALAGIIFGIGMAVSAQNFISWLF